MIAELNTVNPDIVLLCETWLAPNSSNGFLNIQGYSIEMRLDRTDTSRGRGGGLIIYIKNGLTIAPLDISNSVKQCLLFKCQEINFALIYRSPNAHRAETANIVNLLSCLPSNTIVIGDLNYPSIDWVGKTAHNLGKTFLDGCIENNFDQHVLFPTHNRGNILDLVLANNDSIVHVDNGGFLSSCDHVNIIIQIVTRSTEKTDSVDLQ